MKKRRISKRSRSSASSVELHAVAETSPNAKFIEVLVNGCPLSFKVDSGAEVSYVSSTFNGFLPRLHTAEDELKVLDNHTLPVLGTYQAIITWKGKSMEQKLCVLASKTVPLLGFPAIQALGVCKFLGHV